MLVQRGAQWAAEPGAAVVFRSLASVGEAQAVSGLTFRPLRLFLEGAHHEAAS